MADDADSKSVVGNHVWVQVPLPALKIKLCDIVYIENLECKQDSLLYI